MPLEPENSYEPPSAPLTPATDVSTDPDEAARAILARSFVAWTLVRAMGAGVMALGTVFILMDIVILSMSVSTYGEPSQGGPGASRPPRVDSPLLLLPTWLVGATLLTVGKGLQRFRPWARLLGLLGGALGVAAVSASLLGIVPGVLPRLAR